jgi:hypothetical protein
MMMMVSVVHHTRSLGIAAQVKMTVMMMMMMVMLMVMVTVVVVMMVMVMVMMLLLVVVVVEFLSQVYTSTFIHTYDVSNYMC